MDSAFYCSAGVPGLKPGGIQMFFLLLQNKVVGINVTKNNERAFSSLSTVERNEKEIRAIFVSNSENCQATFINSRVGFGGLSVLCTS